MSEADQEKARAMYDSWFADGGRDDEIVGDIAGALAEEREKGIDIGLQNATSIDHFEVGHCCRLCGETWPCDRARTVGLQ